MSTFREHISEIIKESRLLYMDQYVPNYYIYHKLVNKAQMLIKRDSDTRRLFAQRHIFSTINRFKMIADDTNFFGVGNFTGDRFFMKSEEVVPDAFITYTGLAITINTIQPSDKLFVETTYDNYKFILDREYTDPTTIYYWMQDHHLILPDVHYRAVRIDGLFIDPLKIKMLNGTYTDCERLLDQELACPEYLTDDIRNAVVVDIIKEYSATRPDDVPDMSESNKVAAMP